MSLSKQSELFAIWEARNNLIIHLFTLTTLKPSLPETVSEALRKAPPEHLEVALTVLTEPDLSSGRGDTQTIVNQL